jgi:hypothetical protein
MRCWLDSLDAEFWAPELPPEDCELLCPAAPFEGCEDALCRPLDWPDGEPEELLEPCWEALC